MPRLPTLFVSHGAPNLVLHNSEAKRFLAGFAADLPRPKAILVASAHFDTPARARRRFTISAASNRNSTG